MDAEPGYIYLLINPAMPGLVKVGRTSRSPSERIDELSAATGVPTPFELVYDVLVPDVVAGERFMHARLTQAGYRVSENREFFRAPIRDVVRLMLHLREIMDAVSVSTGRMSLVDDGPHGLTTDEGRDPLFLQAARLCVEHEQGTASLLQRKLNVGYARASQILDQLSAAGVLAPPDGALPRRPLISALDLEMFGE